MARSNTIEVDPRSVFRVIPVFIVVFTLFYLVYNSAFTVDAGEKGVVFSFGKYSETVDPGLHFKRPVIDEVVILNVQENQLRLPFDNMPEGNSRNARHEDEAMMLTADLSAVVVEWTIQWKIEDPYAYLIAINDTGDYNEVLSIIRNVARSVMHQVTGDYSFDEVLTSKRADIGNSAREMTQELLNKFKSGIRITGLQMQRITAAADVKPAFDAVNSASQRREQLINEANRDVNELIPKAESEKDRSIREAQGYADARKAETEGEITALRATYAQYKAAPEATRQRLYLEAMEEILSQSGSKIIIDDSLKGLLPLLDLNGGTSLPAAGKMENLETRP